MLELDNNQEHVIPLIWQGDTGNASPGYAQRRGLVGSSSDGIPQCAFQGTMLEIGAAPTAYTSQYLPVYNQLINTVAPMTIDAVMIGEAGAYTLSSSVTLESDFDNSGVKVVFILTRHISNEYFSSVVAYENIDFDLTAAGASGSYSHDFSIDSSWASDDIKGYVLVQKFNSTDGEIYQGAEAGTAAVTTTGMDFGAAYIGSSFTRNFSVVNIGSDDSTVELAFTGSGFDISGETSYSLAPGEMQEHSVTFAPNAENVYSGTLTITTTIPGFENNTVTLDGSGFLDHAPVIENLTIDGILMKNHSIEASYDFVDEDNDTEGPSVYKWYESTDQVTWTEYFNINTDYFTINISDELIGKFMKFVVNPQDEHGMPGEEVLIETSSPIIDLGAPTSLTSVITDGNNIVLNWEAPEFPTVRGLFGYKVLRGTSYIATITSSETFTYTDENVEDGEYTYAVKSIFTPGGLSGNSNEITILIENGEAVVSNSDDAIALTSVSNGPNPFSTSTTIAFQTKRSSKVKVDVYNVKGQLINTLENSSVNAGNHEVVWNGNDKNGNSCSAGVYFYRIITPGKTISKKMILVK